MTYKEILWTPAEIEYIQQHGEISPAAAKEAISRSKINFDDIEDINEHYENHRWGSDADRAYRKRAVNRAVQHVAANAAAYLPGVDRRAYYNRKILERLKFAVISYEQAKKQEIRSGTQNKQWAIAVREYQAAFDAAETALIPQDEQEKVANEARREATA